MIRETELVSYLPPIIAEYKEIRATLEAENPEFRLVWEAADRVLRNEFIATADVYGISRFEKIMGILPLSEDTPESRRMRIQSRWFLCLPYTWRMLIRKLVSLCGEKNFTARIRTGDYRLELEVRLELPGQTEELELMLDEILPCSLFVDTGNRQECITGGMLSACGGIAYAEEISIMPETGYYISGTQCVCAGIACTQDIHITEAEERGDITWQNSAALSSRMTEEN